MDIEEFKKDYENLFYFKSENFFMTMERFLYITLLDYYDLEIENILGGD